VSKIFEKLWDRNWKGREQSLYEGDEFTADRIEIKRVSKEQLSVRIYSIDGRLAYDLGPYTIMEGHKLTLRLPKNE